MTEEKWTPGERVLWQEEVEIVNARPGEDIKVRLSNHSCLWVPRGNLYPIPDPAAPTVEDVLEAAVECWRNDPYPLCPPEIVEERGVDCTEGCTDECVWDTRKMMIIHRARQRAKERGKNETQ